MEIATGCASNLVAEVAKFMFQNIKLPISYVFHHKKRVANLEEKVKTLNEKRERVQSDVDAAGRNGEKIYTDVDSWLNKVDKIINAEAKEVKDLEEKAKNKCFIGLCPNFKSRYQLSKKVEEKVNIVDELLQQGGFDKVSYRDVPQVIEVASPKDFEAFDSRKQVFDEILEALKDPSINIIGVYGMGGVGKTTLVKEVARKVKDKLFDSVVMAAVTQTPDIRKIQDQIADMLGLKFEEQSMTGRASRLCERLKKGKKILVVLDDIWARLDLMEVGIPFGDEDMRCTVLLTSRVQNVLLNDKDAQKKIQIDVLTPEEAWVLFKKTAGKRVESPDLRSTATEVAKKCAGLPIAISTVATALRNKESFVWKDALRKLSNPSPSNLRSGVPAEAYSPIELSFNYLESDEYKDTFLLCSLLGHNTSILDLLKYSMGLGLFDGVSTVEDTRNRLLTVVSHLKASCLLLDSYNSLCFDMHDLTSDVAISIASKDNRVFAKRHADVLKDWPDGETMKRCDKIILKEASINKLPDQLKCPELSFFFMDNKDPSMNIPEYFFKEMKSLKVLDLTRMHFPLLPSSIYLLANLRTLCLDHCVLGDIAIIGELKNLEILSLVFSDIERLPKEIGQLIKLKMLDTSHCTKLKIIPPNVLSSLSKLEELSMDYSFIQWEAEEPLSQRSNASLAELKALFCLTALVVHIPNAKIIPKDLCFEKLERYKVFIGEAWNWEAWNWVGEIEYSRTLKLKPHTNIGDLGDGVKMLLMKAENLYLDEIKGVEILLHESEGRECFQQLKNLYIQNGALIQHIIKDNDVNKIEFVQLHSLTLQGLPKLISFCSQDNGSTSISPQGLPLFNEKLMFPKLENLKLSSISIERIWQYQLPRESYSFENLTSFIMESCSNLKHVLSYSMAEYLQQLKCLEIIDCKSIQEIISMEEIKTEEYGKRALICFPRLNSLKLKGLQKLMGFCLEDYIVEFQSLKILHIEDCPELKEFIINKSSTDKVLFNEKISFPNLEEMTISNLKNVKSIWYSQPQLHGDSFCKLKELTVEYCDELLNIFSSFLLPVFQRLEMLRVIDCASLEEVFELQRLDIKETGVVAIQLRYLILHELPKLKHVWNKDPYGNISFRNLFSVSLSRCGSLKNLFPFSIAKDLPHLESLQVSECGVEEIVSKNIEGLQQEICFKFDKLSFLFLWYLSDLKCFYPGAHTIEWPVLKKLKTNMCEKIKIFGHGESQNQRLFPIEKVIPRLEEVSFISDDIAMICDGQFAADFFGHIKVLGIFGYLNEPAVFPFSFLRRFYNLEMLEVGRSNFKDLSPYEVDVGEEKDEICTLPKIKNLRLNGLYKMTHLWKQDSQLDHICASLETLEVWFCRSLINLAPAPSSFQNLTTLDVWDCEGMEELIASSKAQSLVCLVTMTIRECKMMTEIVASKGDDEATYEITFRKLRYLKLHCLESLRSFSSGNYTFNFPSLEQVILTQCPTLKNFCEGDLSTPKLQEVEVTETDYKGRWAGNLNATVQQLYREQNVQISEESLYLDDMKDVEILLHRSEGRKCFPELKNLYIQNGELIQYIIKDDDVDKIEFVQLHSLTMQGLPKLISFCSQDNGSTSISPQRLPLFNEKLLFPKLENLKLSSISIERIWQYQLSRESYSFQNLTSFIIESCSNLKYVLSYFMAEYLQQLKCLEIIDCKSIQEIISTEEMKKEEYGKRAVISFPRLNSLKLKGLQKLIGFCLEDYIVEFQSLKILHIEDCPALKEFIINKSSTDKVLFNEKIAFPNLEEMTISNLKNVKSIWCSQPQPQLHGDSFCKLKRLKVEKCDELLNIFSSFLLPVCQRLEMLRVTDCASLEEVFELQRLDIKETGVVAIQLRELFLHELPKLKHVWNKDPYGNISFHNLRLVDLRKCFCLKSLFPFSIAKDLSHLESLIVWQCGVEEIVSKNIEGLQLEICFKFDKLSFLFLWRLPDLKCFYPGAHTIEWPALTKLKTYGCEKIKIFGHGESQNQQPLFSIEKVIPRLEEVYFTSDDIAMISDDQFAADFFGHLKVIGISGYLNEPAVFSFSFLQRFYNLEMLELYGCNFKDLSPYEVDVGEEKDETCALPKIKTLKLIGLYKITSLWKQDSQLDHICASLETLEVWYCDSLINLAPAPSSFQNLTTLDVCECDGMAELIASSKAQSLVCLVTMIIRECKMMTEIVASKGDDGATYEITFKKLKCLKLLCLKTLRSFCSGNYTFNFPSLEQVILTECPTLKNFCEGDLSTPELQEVQVTETDYKWRWAGNLNATVEQLYREQTVQISEENCGSCSYS